MLHRNSLLFWLSLSLIIFLTACSSPTATPEPQPTLAVTTGIAAVKAVEILQLAGEPSQVRVVAQVTLPDTCTRLDQVDTERVASAFRITITTRRQADSSCQLSESVFEKVIPLEIGDAPPGEYAVVVNDQSASFTYAGVAHSAPALPAQTEPPPAAPPAIPAEPAPAVPTVPADEARPPAVVQPPPAEAAECLDRAAFSADVTVPDGSIFRQRERFTKTWKLRNEGTCTFSADYALVFAGGELLNAPLSVPLGREVAPGEFFTVSVSMAAPEQGGSYQSNWEMQNARGDRFGFGASRKEPVWVRIQVGWVDPYGGDQGQGEADAAASCGEERETGFENQVLALINAVRVQNGLRQLIQQNQLTQAALGHSIDMACNNFTSHTGSNGSSFKDRIAAQGYEFSYASENIYFGAGAGYGDPQTAVEWWMNSTVHRANILNPDVTQIGIGYVYYAYSQYGGYYTVNFARP